MNTAKANGWKPIPLSLKIIFVLLIVWMAGAVLNLPHLYGGGAPLAGNIVKGPAVAIMVVFLDIIGPLVFLYGLWNRKAWAPRWAFFYMGLFILNCIVAFVTLRDVWGVPMILLPAFGSAVFLSVIFWKRRYFSAQ